MTTSPTPPAPTTTFVRPGTDAATRARLDQAVAWIGDRAAALAAEAPADPSRRWERRFIAETGAAPDDETRAERAVNERIAAELNRAFPTAVAAMMWVTADEVGLLRGTDDSLFAPEYLASDRVDILAGACERHDARTEKLATRAAADAAREAEWRAAEAARATAHAEAKVAEEAERAARAQAKASRREARAETNAAKRAARIEAMESEAAAREAHAARRAAAKEAGRAARHAEREQLVAGATRLWKSLTNRGSATVAAVGAVLTRIADSAKAVGGRPRNASIEEVRALIEEQVTKTPKLVGDPQQAAYGWHRPDRSPAPDPIATDANPIATDAETLDPKAVNAEAPPAPSWRRPIYRAAAPGLLRRPPRVAPEMSNLTDAQREAVSRIQTAVIADFGVAVTDGDTTDFVGTGTDAALRSDERLISPGTLEAMAASIRSDMVAELPNWAPESRRNVLGGMSDADLVAVALQSLGLQQETKQVVVLRPIGR